MDRRQTDDADIKPLPFDADEESVFESTMSRPWRVRRVLYLIAGLFAAGLLLVEPNWRTSIVTALAAGGVATSLSRDALTDPSPRRLGLMASYDAGVAIVLASLGLQYSSVVILIGAIAAVALLRPSWRPGLTPLAGLAGASLALATITVGGREALIPPLFENRTIGLFTPMASMAMVSAGLAWLFASIGSRLEELATAHENLRRSLDSKRAPTLIVDGDDIVYANPAAAVFAGRALVGGSLEATLGIRGPFAPGERVQTTATSSADARVSIEIQADPITYDARSLVQITVLSLQPDGPATPPPGPRHRHGSTCSSTASPSPSTGRRPPGRYSPPTRRCWRCWPWRPPNNW